ncbi:uncharacterized protein LOC131254068 [Magnolia sinica]|uniref:uncharacterized protein LOC131254068 n=1 Tax=Magnolia sinica TaxID=86752 RepID=UPI00265B1C6D|nr:uncharacterized protein LOC131254068 [Magnolia sinica]
MGNSLRCCLACVLPCGALDMIRIVHLNGHVEEHSGPITAGEVMKSNPNHVLSRPCSQGVVRKILILSPGSDLKRGHIYFLIPTSSIPEKQQPHEKKKSFKKNDNIRGANEATDEEEYVTDVHLKKKASRRDRRKGRATVWQPNLESISEDL